jgi:hypothetical protein
MTCHERLKEGPRTKIENVVGGGGVNKKCKSHFVGRKPTSSFASKSAAFVIRRSRAGRESTLLLDRAHSLTPHKLIAKRERERERQVSSLQKPSSAACLRVGHCEPRSCFAYGSSTIHSQHIYTAAAAAAAVGLIHRQEAAAAAAAHITGQENRWA